MNFLCKTTLSAMLVAVSSIGFATNVAGQETLPRVAVHDDWSVFETNQGTRECWIVSSPTQSVARRGGQNVEVRRGKIEMMISFRPQQGVANEVSFTGGYPFREDSRVEVEIRGDTFEMFTEGEWSWPASPAIDGKIVAAMRASGSAKITGVSGRGTTTIDTISAIGFTAALRDAERRCG